MDNQIANVERKAGGVALGVCVGFTVGFIMGAAVVAVLDQQIEKINRLMRLRRDTDENYIYSD